VKWGWAVTSVKMVHHLFVQDLGDRKIEIYETEISATMPNETSVSYTVDPCIFPTLTQDDVDGYRKIHFAHQLISELRSFCHQESVSLHHVVAAAWALVLREYSAAENVAFALQNVAGTRSFLVQVKTQTATPIARLLRGITGRKEYFNSQEVDVQPLSKSLQSCINTGVRYHESGHENLKIAVENGAQEHDRFDDHTVVSAQVIMVMTRTDSW
jgi:hypothetical protein